MVLSSLAVLAAYLIGSLSFAVIVSRVMGLNDPRTYGSKNPGATNVLRSGSKAAAVLTLLLDALKGWLPVALVLGWGQPYGMAEGTAALVGLAATTIFLRILATFSAIFLVFPLPRVGPAPWPGQTCATT